MSDNQSRFDQIRKSLVNEHEDVAIGKMMSSEALTYKKKVFAFYMSDEVMCFKLGRDFATDDYGIEEYSVFSPFKNKAPMVDWLLIPDADKWEQLAQIAYTRMKDTLG